MTVVSVKCALAGSGQKCLVQLNKLENKGSYSSSLNGIANSSLRKFVGGPWSENHGVSQRWIGPRSEDTNYLNNSVLILLLIRAEDDLEPAFEGCKTTTGRHVCVFFKRSPSASEKLLTIDRGIENKRLQCNAIKSQQRNSTTRIRNESNAVTSEW